MYLAPLADLVLMHRLLPLAHLDIGVLAHLMEAPLEWNAQSGDVSPVNHIARQTVLRATNGASTCPQGF